MRGSPPPAYTQPDRPVVSRITSMRACNAFDPRFASALVERYTARPLRCCVSKIGVTFLRRSQPASSCFLLRSRASAPAVLALLAVAFWSTHSTAQTQCLSFTDSIDGIDKNHALEESLKSLREQIEKWKADNGVTSPVTVTAEKPQPHPFWRSSVPTYEIGRAHV